MLPMAKANCTRCKRRRSTVRCFSMPGRRTTPCQIEAGALANVLGLRVEIYKCELDFALPWNATSVSPGALKRAEEFNLPAGQCIRLLHEGDCTAMGRSAFGSARMAYFGDGHYRLLVAPGDEVGRGLDV